MKLFHLYRKSFLDACASIVKTSAAQCFFTCLIRKFSYLYIFCPAVEIWCSNSNMETFCPITHLPFFSRLRHHYFLLGRLMSLQVKTNVKDFVKLQPCEKYDSWQSLTKIYLIHKGFKSMIVLWLGLYLHHIN